MIQDMNKVPPALRRRRSSSGIRIVLLDTKGGVRNVSESHSMQYVHQSPKKSLVVFLVVTHVDYGLAF